MTDPKDEAIRVLTEALEWVWIINEKDHPLDPYEAIFYHTKPQRAEWYCLGCNSIFVSHWPSWVQPTDETFLHEATCPYLKAKHALQHEAVQATRKNEKTHATE